MKKLFATTVVATMLAFSAQAEDSKVTVKGEGQCAKCSLNETKKCQNAIKTAEGKTYYLVENAVSKKFHHQLCEDKKKIVAMGTVKEVDGKNHLTATKIELVK